MSIAQLAAVSAPRTATHIRNDILEAEQQLKYLIVPALAPLERNVTYFTTKALIDPAYKGDLVLADQKWEEAKALHRQKGDLQNRIADLQRELETAEFAERAHRIRELNAKTAELASEYHTLSKQLLAAYRRCQAHARLAGGTPGASTAVPRAPGLSNLVPQSWDGLPVEETIRTQLLPCEQQEAA